MQVGFCGLDKASNSPHSTSQLDVRTICKGYVGFDLAMMVLQVRCCLPRLPCRAIPPQVCAEPCSLYTCIDRLIQRRQSNRQAHSLGGLPAVCCC